MEIIAYGEDALTFWAMKNKLPTILQVLKDTSDPDHCQGFFRPSFGRRGGKNSSQLGEFDFILLTDMCIYLGESKWQRSSEKISEGVLELRAEQLTRHIVFKFYIEEWAFGSYPTWRTFEEMARIKLDALNLTKQIAPAESQLARNLQTILDVIKRRYTVPPTIKNVLLFLHDGAAISQLPQKAGRDFEVVAIDYSEDDVSEGFIKL